MTCTLTLKQFYFFLIKLFWHYSTFLLDYNEEDSANIKGIAHSVYLGKQVLKTTFVSGLASLQYLSPLSKLCQLDEVLKSASTLTIQLFFYPQRGTRVTHSYVSDILKNYLVVIILFLDCGHFLVHVLIKTVKCLFEDIIDGFLGISYCQRITYACLLFTYKNILLMCFFHSTSIR